MAVPSERRFARRLRRLSPTELASFVAALYGARGYDVTRNGRRVRVDTGTGERVILTVAGRRPSAPPADVSVDTVVAARSTRGVRRLAADRGAGVLGPSSLHSMVRYALARETAARLCRTHLGRGFVGRVVDGLSGRVTRGTVLVVGVAFALVVAGTLAVAGVGLPEFVAGRGIDGSPGQKAPAGVGVGAPDGPRPVDTSPIPDNNFPSDSTGVPPPGLSMDGITDADALARAHSEAVAGRVYRQVTVHRGSRSASVTVGRPVVVGAAQWRYENATQVARVAAPGTFHYTVDGTRERSGATRQIRYDVYADGDRSYSRTQTGDGVYYWQTDVNARNDGPHATRARRFIARYLATGESTVTRVTVDGATRYRVVATGAPERVPRAVGAYRAVALVTPAGVVRELNVSYAVASERRRVRFTMRHDRFGQQTVFPPTWVAPAREHLAELGGSGPLNSIHLPPGIGFTGVLDADELADAHERLARERRYRWTVRHNGTADAARTPLGRLPALLGSGADRYDEATAVARVAGAGNYRYAVEGTTANGSGPPAHVEFEVYADGTNVFRREVGNQSVAYHRQRVGEADGNAVLAARAGRYVRRALAGRRAAVEAVSVEGETYYRVRAPPNPRDLGGADHYVSAVVTDSGFVRALVLGYERNGSRVRLHFQYDRLGNATAPPPPWYETARDRTEDGNVTTSASDGGQRGPPGEDWLT